MKPITRKYSDKLFQMNSNWTSLVLRGGWRHYRISGRRWRDDLLELEMMSVCDRALRFWVSVEELRDALAWEPGWTDC